MDEDEEDEGEGRAGAGEDGTPLVSGGGRSAWAARLRRGWLGPTAGWVGLLVHTANGPARLGGSTHALRASSRSRPTFSPPTRTLAPPPPPAPAAALHDARRARERDQRVLRAAGRGGGLGARRQGGQRARRQGAARRADCQWPRPRPWSLARLRCGAAPPARPLRAAPPTPHPNRTHTHPHPHPDPRRGCGCGHDSAAGIDGAAALRRGRALHGSRRAGGAVAGGRATGACARPRAAPCANPPSACILARGAEGDGGSVGMLSGRCAPALGVFRQPRDPTTPRPNKPTTPTTPGRAPAAHCGVRAAHPGLRAGPRGRGRRRGGAGAGARGDVPRRARRGRGGRVPGGAARRAASVAAAPGVPPRRVRRLAACAAPPRAPPRPPCVAPPAMRTSSLVVQKHSPPDLAIS